MQHIWNSDVPVVSYEALQGLQIRYASFSNAKLILAKMKNQNVLHRDSRPANKICIASTTLIPTKINKLQKLEEALVEQMLTGLNGPKSFF